MNEASQAKKKDNAYVRMKNSLLMRIAVAVDRFACLFWIEELDPME